MADRVWSIQPEPMPPGYVIDTKGYQLAGLAGAGNPVATLRLVAPRADLDADAERLLVEPLIKQARKAAGDAVARLGEARRRLAEARSRVEELGAEAAQVEEQLRDKTLHTSRDGLSRLEKLRQQQEGLRLKSAAARSAVADLEKHVAAVTEEAQAVVAGLMPPHVARLQEMRRRIVAQLEREASQWLSELAAVELALVMSIPPSDMQLRYAVRAYNTAAKVCEALGFEPVRPTPSAPAPCNLLKPPEALTPRPRRRHEPRSFRELRRS